MTPAASDHRPVISPPASFRPIDVDDPEWPAQLGGLAQDIVDEWDELELPMAIETLTLEIVAELTELVQAVSSSPFVSSVLAGALVHESLPLVTCLGVVGLGLVEACEPHELINFVQASGSEGVRVEEGDGLPGLIRVSPSEPVEAANWVQWLLAGDPTVVGVGVFEGPAWSALADAWTVSFERLAQESVPVGLPQ